MIPKSVTPSRIAEKIDAFELTDEEPAGVYLMAFGGLVNAFGEADDSPGLSGLGLTTALIGVVMSIRGIRGRHG